MAKVEMVMPKLGESIIEATIISWSKKIGDPIEAEETVLEIATDKVDSEVPAPVGGILTDFLFKDGDVVPVGTVIAYIETQSAITGTTSNTNSPSTSQQSPPQPIASTPTIHETATAKVSSLQQDFVGINASLAGVLLVEPVVGRFYSPLVLNIAREEKIGMDELDRVPGTGAEGRVTKKDILDYVSKRKSSGATSVSMSNSTSNTSTVNGNISQGTEAIPVGGTTVSGYSSTSNSNIPQSGPGLIPKKTFSFSGDVEIIEMDRMRKMISENMVYSKQTSPHVTSFVEADLTDVVLWRNKVKNSFEKQYGQKLTFTPIFIEAIARALREMPLLNSSVDGDKIIMKKDINICVAVALPSGNLIVPVIRRADMLNLAGLAAACNDLTDRARNNKLRPDDLADGTYTLSNVGSFGNVMGTPIIMQPQVGVTATGAIQKKPAVIESPSGDMIAIRHMMFLSHSYDHRIIDGALGGKFVRRVGDILSNWDMNRTI